jgi:hypothetical protein
MKFFLIKQHTVDWKRGFFTANKGQKRDFGLNKSGLDCRIND